jgi:hypothetical protein
MAGSAWWSKAVTSWWIGSREREEEVLDKIPFKNTTSDQPLPVMSYLLRFLPPKIVPPAGDQIFNT